MSEPKVNLTRSQLLKLLKSCDWVKKEAAKILSVNEASVRRACERLDIDTELERKASIPESNTRNYAVKQPSNDSKVHEDSFVVIPDLHAEEVDWDYLSAVCNFIRDFKPGNIVQLGDLLDYKCLMAKVKQKYPTFDGNDIKSLDNEFQHAAKILAFIHQSISKKTNRYFLKGNHEYRADIILKEYPEFKSLLDLAERLDFKNWNIYEYLVPVKFGKLNIFHGEFFGVNNVQKHLRHYQKNILYGHTHAIQQDTLASPMRKIPIWGATIGCGCNINPDYQRNKSNQWQHGFAYGWFDKSTGDFDVQIKRVINGKFWAEGKRYGT